MQVSASDTHKKNIEPKNLVPKGQLKFAEINSGKVYKIYKDDQVNAISKDAVIINRT